MKISRLSIVFLSVFCAGCQTAHAPSVSDDARSETGAVTEESVSSTSQSSASSGEQTSEAHSQRSLSQREELHLSYETAVSVRDLVVDLTHDMDAEAQASLQDAIDTFSQDIDALQYYVELAEREPLLDEDHRNIAAISANIEEAIATFAAIIELMP